MALPSWLARFTRSVTNRATRTFAGWLPGFAVVTHVGCRSGRRYRTPVNVFRHDGVYAVALTYGARSEWVKNVISAGTCELEIGGVSVRVGEPRLVTDDARRRVPPPLRPVLRLMRVSQFLELTPLRDDAPEPTPR